MYSLIFLLFAAMFNAVMDTLKDHYSISIFYGLKPTFWNPSVSWKTKWLNYVSIDAWHISKGLMLGCLYFAILFHVPVFGYWDFLIYPIIWFIGFEGLYSHLLVRK